MIEEMEKHADLVRRMEVTKEIRFAMMRRFRKMNNSDQLFISALSFLIAIISMISIVFSDDFSSKQISAIGVFSVSISFYIIMLNYEFSKRDFERKIIQLDSSASRIHNIYIELKNNKAEDFIDKKYREYKKIIKMYNFEHEEIDKNYILSSNKSLQKAGEEISEDNARLNINVYRNSVFSRLRNQMFFPIFCIVSVSVAMWGFYQPKNPIDEVSRLKPIQSVR